MRIFLLTSATMIAFASNSVLNRAAVDGGHADASSFALVRVVAGLLILTMLLTTRKAGLEVTARQRWGGGVALAIYMIGFSLAYISLNAGLGALILFGTVQIVLFAHAAMTGAAPGRGQTVGAVVAFAGLLLALWPQEDAQSSLFGAIAMLVAGAGWAGYTLAGRGAVDAMAATASHFLLCMPFVAVLLLDPGLQMSLTGLGLAILCGALTSGLGYALWYTVLPALPGALAAIVQLSVPIIAILLGAVFLGEAVGMKLVLSALLVIGGIGLAIRRS